MRKYIGRNNKSEVNNLTNNNNEKEQLNQLLKQLHTQISDFIDCEEKIGVLTEDNLDIIINFENWLQELIIKNESNAPLQEESKKESLNEFLCNNDDSNFDSHLNRKNSHPEI